MASGSYFDHYDNLRVHQVMLKDRVRTQAYVELLQALAASGLLQGKVVLDVGTGTGVLAMVAAKHGARKVYAVEGSGGIASLAQALVLHNHLESQVEVICGAIEEVELPEKVDIIISEWMGFYLLHESMLPSVLHARDRWLKPGGWLFPSRAVLYGALVNMAQQYADRVLWWSGSSHGSATATASTLSPRLLYGVDFSCPSVLDAAKQQLVAQPEVEVQVDPKQLVSTKAVLLDLNLYQVQSQDLEVVTATAVFEPTTTATTMHGLCAWFDCYFELPEPRPGVGVVLSTSPNSELTHWRQAVFYFGEECDLQPEDQVRAQVILSRSEASERQYVVNISLSDVTQDVEEDLP